MKPIAITMGDPAGIGPELCLKLLANRELSASCIPVIFGDAEILRAASQATGLPLRSNVVAFADADAALARASEPFILDLAVLAPSEFTPGQVSAATGHAAYRYVNHAIDAALAGTVAAVTTGPLNKEALHLAGHHFPGHTEIFATRTEAKRSCMMQYSDEVTCTFVTVHIGLREVPAALTIERILEVIEMSAETLRKLRQREPKIVVCGLNPHAGENGLFGDREEERIIAPAIALARAKGMNVEGPVPPDTAFLPAKRATTDVFVCMYHDQGHIPLKALAFDHAVNTTLGLPIIRTSVDHGTALEIAWQGKASPGSLFAAVRLAARLADC